MSASPKVFISAVSGDLRSIRQIVKEALLTIDCHPVEQTNFEPDWRTVEHMLRSKIEGCQALIHIAGLRYGAEPDASSLPAGAPRRSYTQMEYDIGRALQTEHGDQRFRVYTFVCPPSFPYDTADNEGRPLSEEPEDLRGLQAKHRAALLSASHLYEQPADIGAVQTRVLALQEQVVKLLIEQAEVRGEVRKARRFGLWAVAALLVVLGAIGWIVTHLAERTNTIASSQKDITARLEMDRITDRALTAYQDRFRKIREQSKDLPNTVIDKMVRLELPGILKVDAHTVATILDTEAPRLASAVDTPLDKKLSALFVMGEYRTVVETGEKRLVESGIPALRTMGDAARALFDKTPDKKHLEAALRYYSGAAALTDRDKEPLVWAENQFLAAWVLSDLARFAEAEPLMRAVVEIRERELGGNSPEMAPAITNLALLLQATNRFGEAEPLFRRALAIDEASHGKDHPYVARDLNNLAGLLHATNRLAEAEPLFRRALTIDESIYGRDHPYVSICLNNLAQLLYTTNRLAEAEPMMKRALAIDEKAYGTDHPNVAIRLNNLAQLFKATNRLADAEPLMRRALAIDEASYGKDHPNVAVRLSNLAQALRAADRMAEAELLLKRALTIDEASYGKDHPAVARDLNNLAQLLKDTGRLAEVELLTKRALAIDEASYGKDHPIVAVRLNNLAQLFYTTNRMAEAEPLYRRALAIDEKSYGKDHPSVAIRLNNLAALLQVTNRSAEAEPMYRRALAIDEASYGKDHPNVVIRLNNLAGLLYSKNRLAEAEPLMRRALDMDEKRLGKDHPSVAVDLNNLAQLLQAASQFAEAEAMMKRALAIDEMSYGKDHPSVIICLNNLAGLLYVTNRLAEAEPLYRRALASAETTYGKDDPNIAMDLNNLSQLLKDAHRLAEAEPLARRMVGIFLKFRATTGRPHPDMVTDLQNYLGICLGLKLPPAEIKNHLEEQRQYAGLAPAEFNAILQEANSPGPEAAPTKAQVVIMDIGAGGQGESLGLKAGDIIQRYSGKEIVNAAQLVRVIGETKGDSIELEVKRGEEVLHFKAKEGRLGVGLANRPLPEAAK